MSDGTHGLRTIKRRGGIAVVQRAEEALVPSMPLSAIRNVDVDHIVSATEMGPLITRLARGRTIGHIRGRKKGDVAQHGWHALHENEELTGPPSVYRCPECGGALWELNDGNLLRYRCHVGHGFSAESLEVGQVNEIEGALWTALRALEERADFRRRMAERARSNGLGAIAEDYDRQTEDAERRAAVVREVLTGDESASSSEAPAAAVSEEHGRRR